MEKIKKKILITGSNGMLGADLKSRLAADYDLYGMDVRSPQVKEGNFFCADVNDITKVDAILYKIRPWLVIHTAAYTDVDGCEKDESKADLINAEGTKNIAMLSSQMKARLVYISTDYVFDGKKDLPYTEEDKTNPINKYGFSKLKGEEFVCSILEEFMIVRTSWLFGRNGKNFVDTIVAKAKQEKVLKVVDDQKGSPTYTVDLAGALARLIESVFNPAPVKTRFGIYHVSNSGDCTWFEFAKKIVELKKLPAEILPTDSISINRPAKRPAMSILDKTKYRNLTGHVMPDWQEALKKYLT